MIFDFVGLFCRLVETKSLGAVLIITCSGLIRVENNCIERRAILLVYLLSVIFMNTVSWGIDLFLFHSREFLNVTYKFLIIKICDHFEIKQNSILWKHATHFPFSLSLRTIIIPFEMVLRLALIWRRPSDSIGILESAFLRIAPWASRTVFDISAYLILCLGRKSCGESEPISSTGA